MDRNMRQTHDVYAFPAQEMATHLKTDLAFAASAITPFTTRDGKFAWACWYAGIEEWAVHHIVDDWTDDIGTTMIPAGELTRA